MSDPAASAHQSVRPFCIGTYRRTESGRIKLDGRTLTSRRELPASIRVPVFCLVVLAAQNARGGRVALVRPSPETSVRQPRRSALIGFVKEAFSSDYRAED